MRIFNSLAFVCLAWSGFHNLWDLMKGPHIHDEQWHATAHIALALFGFVLAAPHLKKIVTESEASP